MASDGNEDLWKKQEPWPQPSNSGKTVKSEERQWPGKHLGCSAPAFLLFVSLLAAGGWAAYRSTNNPQSSQPTTRATSISDCQTANGSICVKGRASANPSQRLVEVP